MNNAKAVVSSKANAKINLSIDVLGKRDDGYHLVEMILQSIPLFDRIIIYNCDLKSALQKVTDPSKVKRSAQIDDNIAIACNILGLPLDKKNLVYKAARMVMDEEHFTDNITIYLEKHIPSGGGLGGGSADGATVLKAMNNMFNLKLTTERLIEMSKKLGSDVPFFIKEGTAFATGVGTTLSSLPSLEKGWLLIVNPRVFVSTEKIYTLYDSMEIEPEDHPNTSLLIKALEHHDFYTVAKNMKNVLEIPAFKLEPRIKDIKKEILTSGAVGSMMSGSGSSVFGLYDNLEKSSKAMEIFRKYSYFATTSKL